MKNRIKRISGMLSLIIAAELIVSLVSAAAPLRVMASQLVISSPEELISFAESVRDDTDTLDRNILIGGDIDMEGYEYVPIPVFAGILDGQGHTIKGISISSNSSNIGFVREVAEQGIIRNLKVEGVVEPRGIMKNVGGIAGVNYGSIMNCSFAGSVLASYSGGGIAGRNMEGGIIDSCVNSASVNCTIRTGGICGFNEGSVLSCENKGDINASKKNAWEINDEREKLLEEEDSEEGIGTNFEKLNPDTVVLNGDYLKELLKNEHRVNHTGGIAGASSGLITFCVNSGKVGYRHEGYKTGGITGYLRGVLSDCENKGSVKGRMDTGGITGLFEPYAREDYHEDSFDHTRENLDDLIDLVEELHQVAGEEDDITQAHIDDIRDSADEMRSSVSGYREHYRAMDDATEAELRGHIDRLREKVDGLELDMDRKNTKNAASALENDMESIQEIMEAAEKAAASGVQVDMSRYSSRIKAINFDVMVQIDTLADVGLDLMDEVHDFGEDLKEVRDRSNELDDFLRNKVDCYKWDLRGTDDDLQSQIDRLAGKMDALSNGLKNTDGRVRLKLDQMVEKLQDLNDTLDQGFDEMDQELSRVKDTDNLEDFYEDVSDVPADEEGYGVLSRCRNSGAVEADIDGGGIAGCVGVVTDAQSDFEVVSSGQVSLNFEKTRKAAIVRCVNKGTVQVRNSCAGGISGRMDMGSAIECENYGYVSTLDGDYSGGIAGFSSFLIRGCSCMSTVSGNDYIGGIAGRGVRLIDNYSMLNVPENPAHQKVGSIAGDVDRDDEDTDVHGNSYVEDGPGAVDGLTYAREAQKYSYADFVSMDGIPDRFRKLTVDFILGDELIRRISVDYGDGVDEEMIPVLAREEGKFGVWQDVDLSCVRHNTTVFGSYVPYLTTIASTEPFPVMLMDGMYYTGTWIDCRKTEDAGLEEMDIPKEVMTSDIYEFEIKSDYPVPEGDRIVHVLSDDYDDADITAIIEDGKIVPLETEEDGRYRVFTLKEGISRFYVLRPGRDTKKWVNVGRAAAAVLLLSVVLFVVLRKRKKAKKGGGDN